MAERGRLGRILGGKLFGLPGWLVIGGGGLAVGLLLLTRNRGGGGDGGAISQEDRQRLDNIFFAMQNLVSEVASGVPPDNTTGVIPPPPLSQSPNLISAPGVGVYVWDKVANTIRLVLNTKVLTSIYQRYGLSDADIVNVGDLSGFTKLSNNVTDASLGQGIPIGIMQGFSMLGGLGTLAGFWDRFREFRGNRQSMRSGPSLPPAEKIDAGLGEIVLQYTSKLSPQNL